MLQTADQLAQILRSALGSDAVIADLHALESHRVDGVTPRLLITPESTDQVVATLRVCTEVQATVIPWGGGTALALGNPPRRADVVIKLHRLDRVLEHDPANLTVSAQCGLSLATLQSTLAAQKQFVPIDAPLSEKATIGGIVAANLNGPRRSAYGNVRDLVIGMKVVLASGEQIKAGGKVVKNVAGYDMCKLFVGALGTLGIITEATLRVAPTAEKMATLLGSGDLIQLEDFAAQIARSALTPAAVFLVRDAAAENWRIGVWCEGFNETVKRQIDELETMAARSGMNRGMMTAEEHDAFWNRLRDFPLHQDRLVYRITLPRAAVFGFVKLVGSWRNTAIVSDTATGTIWLACAARKSALERYPQLAGMARERRGHAIVFAAPAALKAGINVWGASASTLSLMREIKHQFDPDALLNPGRFVGHL